MADLAKILTDPNYVNANAETKQAIFDRWAPQDPNYANANSATQEAIRAKFGLGARPAADVSQIPTGGYNTEGLPAPRQPSFGQRMTRGYEAGVKALEQTLPSLRELTQPSAEMLIAAEAARKGGQAGAMVAPFLGPAGPAAPIVGAVLGGGLSIAGTRGLLKAPETMGKGVTEAALELGRDIRTGITEQGFGTAAQPVLGKVVEKTKDFVNKTLDLKNRQATRLARAAAGDKIDAIRAALAGASPDETAAQATAGIPRKAWQSFTELGNRLDKTDQILANQVDDIFNDFSRLARGGNPTEIRNALEESRRVLNALTEPMRQIELSAANQAGQTISRLQPQIAQKERSLVSALQESGRMQTEAAQRGVAAQKQFGRIPEEGGIPSISARQAGRSQAALQKQFGETAEDFAAVRTQRRREADFLTRQIGSLEDYGLRPLNVDNVLGAIDSAMATPGRRISATQTQVLSRVKDQIARAASMNNGIVDARDLYTIRKEGVNEIIDALTAGQDPQVSKKVAASVLSIVRPAIDDAITAAGGTGWKAYLDTFAQGAKEIEKREMAALAAKMFKDSPGEYVKLVRGGNDAAVEAIFGKGNYDIFKEMAREMPTLQKAASYIERQKVIETAAAGGREELNEIIKKNTWKKRLPNWFSPTVTAVNLSLKDIENRLSDTTLAMVREATTSGKSMLDLLNGLPPKERLKLTRILNTIKAPEAASAVAPTVNALTSEPPQNALAQ